MAANVIGSRELTPNSNPLRSRVIVIALTIPKWRSSLSACCRVLEKCLTRADIVREAILRQLSGVAKEIPDLILPSHHTEL